MNLFEKNEIYRQLEEREDLDIDVLKDTLETIDEDRNLTLDNIAWMIESNEDRASRLKTKAKEFNEEAKRLIKKNETLMNYMTEAIDDMGVKEVETENHILKPRNYKASVEIVDQSAIPNSFKEMVAVEKVDKTNLYQALKSGEAIPGAELKPNRKTVIK